MTSKVRWIVVDEGGEDFREGSWGEEGVEQEVGSSCEEAAD